MRAFFFTLCIFFIISLGYFSPAYAESGKNFNREQIGENTFKWSSHYDRVWDGTKWVNYLWGDANGIILFQSSGIIYKFDKSTCEFSLLQPDTWQTSVSAFSHELTINGTKEILPACLVSTTPATDSLDVVATRSTANGILKTVYEIDAVGFMEWTHEITYTDSKKAKLGVQETCKGCEGVVIGTDKIDFGDYILDTKNRVHNTLKSTDDKTQDYVFVYEGDLLSKNEKLVIDPVFSGVASLFGYAQDDGANDICDTNGSTSDQTAGDMAVGTLLHATIDCTRGYVQFDTSSILNNAIITNSSFQFDIGSVTSPRNWDIHHMVAQPSTESTVNKFLDAANGTTYVNTDVVLTAGDNKDVDLGATADSDIQSRLVERWFAIGLVADSEAGAGTVTHQQQVTRSGTPVPTLTVTYTASLNAVTDLYAFLITGDSITLDWTTPTPTNEGNVTGYQINFTTPYSNNPQTVVKNDTGTTTTSYIVGNLTQLTPYSFRVGVWTDLGGNASGNILNVTTLQIVELGDLDINVTNPSIFPIRFERLDINTTALNLNVTYPIDFNLTCTFHYKFAMINTTHNNLPRSNTSSTEAESQFTFLNVDDEVIDAFCRDVSTGEDARYVITQTVFPFLQLAQNFTGGVYGTQGDFGAIDFITLAVIIVSMIGFNRVNPAVGAVFSVMVIGVAFYFTLIELPTVIFAGIATTLMVAVALTKRD